ncbi:serine/threonine protein kinase [Spirulina subsalsa]|uniref:serine/threonine protein kinase n=1 Tax=Spirulina subsalsa TaxID=54311 RepID=UPI000314FD4A|nr:serine/threonine-protein kinase [Spirulina subsalsa]
MTTTATYNDFKYSLDTTIGQGIFSLTYQAVEVGTGKPVMIKTLASSLQDHPQFPKFRERFLKLAQQLKQCVHPHLPGIWEFFEEDGQPYIVYDRILGVNLADHVAAQGRIPEDQAREWINQIASALQRLHQQGLKHLDVHPRNIIYRPETNDVVLVDFGFTAELTPEIRQTHANLIAPGYSALEQHNPKKPCSSATDIYSLSATFYFMLTGDAPPPVPVLGHIPPEKWQKFPREISSPTRATILRGMALSAIDRPQTVADWSSLWREVWEREQQALQAQLEAQLQAERLENERLARLEAERLENERLARLEAERLENERLARLEFERLENERLARLEAERLENERLARLEAERLENERLARLEFERLENERLARLEFERLENERLARLEFERLENERLARLETERLEAERLARLEFERQIQQEIERQQAPTGEMDPSPTPLEELEAGSVALTVSSPQKRPKTSPRPTQKRKGKARPQSQMVKVRFPMGALLMTSAIAASAGAGFGLSLRLNRPTEAGSSFWHVEQSFPPREFKEQETGDE